MSPSNIDCTTCGACCFGTHDRYIGLLSEDRARAIPESLTNEIDGRRYMKMCGGHCAQLARTDDARLVCGTYDGLAIPDDAIISEGLTTYVYVARDGAAARTEVSVGSSVGELTEVSDGLSPQDDVVISGWANLTDGAPVQIVDDVAAVTGQ